MCWNCAAPVKKQSWSTELVMVIKPGDSKSNISVVNCFSISQRGCADTTDCHANKNKFAVTTNKPLGQFYTFQLPVKSPATRSKRYLTFDQFQIHVPGYQILSKHIQNDTCDVVARLLEGDAPSFKVDIPIFIHLLPARKLRIRPGQMHTDGPPPPSLSTLQ